MTTRDMTGRAQCRRGKHIFRTNEWAKPVRKSTWSSDSKCFFCFRCGEWVYRRARSADQATELERDMKFAIGQTDAERAGLLPKCASCGHVESRHSYSFCTGAVPGDRCSCPRFRMPGRV